MNKRWKASLAISAGLAVVLAFVAAGPPMDQMEENAPPAASQPAGDATAWVDKIDAASTDLHGLEADVRYLYVQGAMSDQQVRLGKFTYWAGPPMKFIARFDSLLVNHRKIDQDRSYIFDGRWLVERHDDEKRFTKREVVSPDAPPGEIDPLTQAQGPFALPITPHKKDLLSRYDVTLAESGKDDPADTFHLHMVGKPGFMGDHKLTVDVWYDKEKLVPVKAITVDDSGNQSTVELTEVKINPPIDAAAFDTKPPSGPGWTLDVKQKEEEE